MLGHLMMSSWKVEIWNKKHFSLFHECSYSNLVNKYVADTDFNAHSEVGFLSSTNFPMEIELVFSIWKSLQVLWKAHIRIVAHTIYMHQIFSYIYPAFLSKTRILYFVDWFQYNKCHTLPVVTLAMLVGIQQIAKMCC